MFLREKEMSLESLPPGRKDSSRKCLLVQWKGGGKMKNKVNSFNSSKAREVDTGALQGLVLTSVLMIIVNVVGAHPDPP